MLSSVILFIVLISGVWGHGMVMDPPNRSSVWRFNPSFPPNYDDNGIFCGGRYIQWEVNGGKCGPCGDDVRLPQPRPNENMGTYGRGYVVKTYNKGQIIRVSVLITANHMGWFKFALCKLNNPLLPETDDCFQDLKLANGKDVYDLPSKDVGYYEVDLQLPATVTCDRCVLRWHYNTGNSWGVCPNGEGKLGCGPQENFRTCSDISIV